MNAPVIVNLPFFPGFYESMLSQTLDNAENREADNNAEKEAFKEYYPETYQPEELRLDSGDYSEIMFDCMNYDDAYQAMARDYCDAFDTWANDNLETPAESFTFESMDSPREYNFTTDRVYVTVPFCVMESLYKGLDRDKFREAIEARHTSYDGFISFYNNDIEAWLKKPLDEYDHNEFGTLICAAITASVDHKNNINWDICEAIFESDHEYVDNHCDWKKVEEKARAKRAEKLAKWIRDDPDAASNYIDTVKEALELLPIALDELDNDEREAWEVANGISGESRYRCPLTLDLFPETIQK